jgi:DNA helicase II / ATP-dependent DNA helicase PcrA
MLTGLTKPKPGRAQAPRRTLTLDEFLAACEALGDRPNPEQRAVIEAVASEDLHLVAGPGTGKTSSVVLRILKVVLVDGMRPSGVVATTFTVKAAAELRSRLLTRGFALVEHLANDSALPAVVRERVARLDINQITTNTVDGLCQSVLRDHREPGTNPPVIVDEFVASTLMLRAGLFENQRYRDDDLDGYLLTLNGRNRFGWNIGRKFSVLRTMWDRRFHDQVDWAAFTAEPNVPSTFADALTAYETELRERQMVDFALLEQTVLDRLRAGGLASFTQCVQAIFVDEYQDTNLLQESL